MEPQAERPVLKWTITNPDGTIVAEGFATPFTAGATAQTGSDPEKKEEEDGMDK